MQTRDIFFENYDEIMPLICPAYNESLEIAASAIPKNAKSILDLGIGTGNFSLKVKEKIPNIKIYGIDLEQRLLEKTKTKIPGAKLYCKNILNGDFPKTDYILSSFATHHFPTEIRSEELLKIARASKGFVNVDLAIFPNQTFENIIQLWGDFAKNSFPEESVKMLEKEMRTNDNPMPLEDIVNLFSSKEFDFKILAIKNSYVVYRVFNKSI
ncbi:MAG: class I SAM-dependent methyltransferase [Candidatus Pacearchaeota archaeon]|jgi:trans-aconitate methyltransferase